MKTIALAVAGLMISGAALAQSSITVSGRVDLGFVHSKSDFNKFQGIEQGQGIGSGGSRLGFTGTEDLGNGLKAIFFIDFGVAADTGLSDDPDPDNEAKSNNLGRRYTWVGLTGNFGTVTAGRLSSPVDAFAGGDTRVFGNGYTPIGTFRGLPQGGMIGGAIWENAISYMSPKFSGLDFTAVYSFGEKVNKSKNSDGSCDITDGGTNKKCADTSDASKLGLGVRYANGPLYVTAAYHAHADNDSKKAYGVDSNAGYGSKGWMVGGSYDFKVVKLFATYYHAKANHGGKTSQNYTGTRLEGSDKQTAWALGASIPVSSVGTVMAEYGQYKDYLNHGDDAGHKAKAYSVGYKHVLSKRTWLSSYVSRFNNDHAINASSTKAKVAGKDETVFFAGIVHTF